MLHDWEYEDIFQVARIFECLEKGKPLDWDYAANTTIRLKDEYRWRDIVWLVLTAVLLAGIIALIKVLLGI